MEVILFDRYAFYPNNVMLLSAYLILHVSALKFLRSSSQHSTSLWEIRLAPFLVRRLILASQVK